MHLYFDERKKGWKCMDPETHKFIVSRNVVFDEVSSYYKVEGAIIGSTVGGTSIHNQPHTEISLPLSPNAPMSSDSSSSFSPTEEQSNRESGVDCHELEGQHIDEEVESAPPLTRSKRKVVFLARYREGNFVSMHSCFLVNPIDDCEPSCFDEATGVKEWESAMNDEMNALIKNQTWDFVPKPKEVKPITCKWVYKIKRKADGSVDRYKARIVAHGFSQKYGEDYDETFSPVAKMISVRVIISLAAHHQWKLWQLDVKNAFLYCEIDKDIYMSRNTQNMYAS